MMLCARGPERYVCIEFALAAPVVAFPIPNIPSISTGRRPVVFQRGSVWTTPGLGHKEGLGTPSPPIQQMQGAVMLWTGRNMFKNFIDRKRPGPNGMCLKLSTSNVRLSRNGGARLYTIEYLPKYGEFVGHPLVSLSCPLF
ncbi:hypothetical protein L209DRAFT_760419 [Thermothelomyces heterothallicus CBS 203.75]